jgi:hypothetical protein
MRLRFPARTLGLTFAIAGAMITRSLSAAVPEFFDGAGLRANGGDCCTGGDRGRGDYRECLGALYV